MRGWDYGDQLDAYKRAVEKSSDPEVLMSLAINWSCPGICKSKIDENQTIKLLENSLKYAPYVEGDSCLIDLYDQNKNGRIKSVLD